MRNQKILRIVALLAVLAALAALSACRAPANAQAQAEIKALLETRAAGVNGADMEKYLSTVLPGDKVLQKEEANLIRAASGLGVKDFEISAGEVREKAEGEYTATVSQRYTAGGEARRCAYKALFKSENGKMYYCGPDFGLKQNSQAIVYFQGAGDDKLAQQLLNEETNALAAMKEQLGFAPAGVVSIKLYDDQQVFLQSVKLDLPAWVGGWHEYGEAVKSFTGAYGMDGESYKSMLNHETTHLMVSELSNDNASYWLQEGLAGIYENALDAPNAPLLSEDELAQDYTAYSEQKQIDLEKIGVDDHAAVSRYYATSKAFAAFMIDEYGWSKVREMLEFMKRYELIPVTAAEKISQTNERTDEAMASVLGLKTAEEIQAAFDRWMSAQRKKG